MKKIFVSFFSVLLCTLIAFTPVSEAAIFTFETQREYDNADIAWLTDLVIKENMANISGIASRLTLSAVPDDDYTETPESFKADVDKYCSLYSLNAGMEKAGIVYIFDLLGSNNNLFSAGITDDDVKDYLQGNGVIYPSTLGEDELIMARALYVAMMSGSFSFDFGETAPLQEALAAYITFLSGVNGDEIKKWLPAGGVLSVEDYILAASRFALWNSGYDITTDTPSDEVFRLVTVMTVEKMGIGVNKNIELDELKSVYVATLLGKKYDVTVNAEKLSEEMQKDNVPFYILRLIGQQKAGLAIRDGSMSYEEAFYTVAENTSVFDLEEGEFYADVYRYEVCLQNVVSSVWLYPTAYVTGSDDADLKITANGKTIKNNFFTEVPVEPSLDEQDVIIKVTCTLNGKTSEHSYVITVYQGTEENEAKFDNQTTSGLGFLSSDSIVAEIFASFGLNKTVDVIMDNFYSALPDSVKSTISFIAPTFETVTLESSTESETSTDSTQILSNEYYIGILDEIGKSLSCKISGINGADIGEGKIIDTFVFDWVTFD